MLTSELSDRKPTANTATTTTNPTTNPTTTQSTTMPPLEQPRPSRRSRISMTTFMDLVPSFEGMLKHTAFSSISPIQIREPTPSSSSSASTSTPEITVQATSPPVQIPTFKLDPAHETHTKSTSSTPEPPPSPSMSPVHPIYQRSSSTQKLHPSYLFSSGLDFDNLLAGGNDGEDLLAELSLDESTMSTASFKFLNQYSEEDFWDALTEGGIKEDLESMGFKSLIIQMDLQDPFVHRLTLSDKTLLTDMDITSSPHSRTIKFNVTESNFLADVFARRRRMSPHDIKGYQDILQTVKDHLKSDTPKDELSTGTTEMHAVSSQSAPQKQHKFRLSFEEAQQVKTFLDDYFPGGNGLTPTPAPSRKNQHKELLLENHHGMPLPPPSPRPGRSLSPAPENGRLSVRSKSRSRSPSPIITTTTATPKPDTTTTANNNERKTGPASVTTLEWVAMQNPLTKWSECEDRPRCPGQHYPGLRVARHLLDELVHMASKNNRDALVSVPEYFHNAIFYAAGGWRFIDPSFEGYFAALVGDLRADIEKHGIAAVSWCLRNGHVKDGEGVVEVWSPLEQFFPVSGRMKGVFESLEYERLFMRSFERFRGRVRCFWEEGRECWRYSVFYRKSEGAVV
ncbi:hypothetical protein HDU76_002021 [Blyttiomyces sp. JEL0837]|nr:hypothetical protein HDU76_002021 [Blyttiomyces sp. JEL0837]